MPFFNNIYVGTNFPYLAVKHSAKGTEWKNHKYIKKENGHYYYPDSYRGGRHLKKSQSNRRVNPTSLERGKSLASIDPIKDYDSWEKEYRFFYGTLSTYERKEFDKMRQFVFDTLGSSGGKEGIAKYINLYVIPRWIEELKNQ